MSLKYFCFAALATVVCSCHPRQGQDEEKATAARVPVTIVHPQTGQLDDVTELNATSSFLLKTSVKASTSGYLLEVNIHLGDYITSGQKLFVIRSKESEHLGNSVNAVDSSLHFSGRMVIKAPGNGYVTQLNYRAGDYVQDGETIATLSDLNSLVFLLEVPYELKPFLPNNKTVRLALPDGQMLTGTVTSPMPQVDLTSQTQNFIVRVPHASTLPENLIATAKFIKKTRQHATSLPKDAILTNEVQSEFWIMKMTDSTTAVKVPVVKGIETDGRVEIVSPVLLPSDRIVLNGNYGLPDTARVKVQNK